MANFRAIHSVGTSMLEYLRAAYPDELSDDHSCEFRLLSSGELASPAEMGTTVSLYLYRIIINEHLRSSRPGNTSSGTPAPLSLDLHYLLTIWADSAAAEHTIAAWVMHQLHHRPLMDVSSLSAEGGWDAGDLIHIIPAELSNEDLMRVWDALTPTYRLSMSYIARVVRIEAPEPEDSLPVVATRQTYLDRLEGADV